VTGEDVARGAGCLVACGKRGSGKMGHSSDKLHGWGGDGTTAAATVPSGATSKAPAAAPAALASSAGGCSCGGGGGGSQFTAVIVDHMDSQWIDVLDGVTAVTA